MENRILNQLPPNFRDYCTNELQISSDSQIQWVVASVQTETSWEVGKIIVIKPEDLIEIYKDVEHCIEAITINLVNRLETFKILDITFIKKQ